MTLIQRLIGILTRRIIAPVVPARLSLPLQYWLQGVQSMLEPELIHLEAICRGGDVAIDVGANEGFFSYRLAPMFGTVYAFEINSDLVANLEAWNPGNIRIMPTGLSSEAQDATLYIPVAHGMELTGWASLAPGNCPDAQSHITKPVRVETLDSFAIKNVSFIKIDVEGHEPQMLQGAEQTIRTNRPIVLVEVKAGNRERVAEFFNQLGYEEVSFESLAGVAGSAENRIYRPRSEAATRSA